MLYRFRAWPCQAKKNLNYYQARTSRQKLRFFTLREHKKLLHLAAVKKMQREWIGRFSYIVDFDPKKSEIDPKKTYN
jgi:hypothetical protein